MYVRPRIYRPGVCVCGVRRRLIERSEILIHSIARNRVQHICVTVILYKKNCLKHNNRK